MVDSRHKYRSYDLELASVAAGTIEKSSDSRFILTGSYALEAVSGSDRIAHNDVDANVFTTDVPRAIAAAALDLSDLRLAPTKRTADRLEYDADESTIELQFVAYDKLRTSNDQIVFEIGDTIEIPTVKESLRGLHGEEFAFRVKSRPFAIATWALRISGAASAQKRLVRQSDIDHFAALTQRPYDEDDVLTAMERHPQMPPDGASRAAMFLSSAVDIVRREAHL